MLESEILQAARLRRLLTRLLPDDESFEAFCAKHFPQVAARFTEAMDRDTRLALLFEMAAKREILAWLYQQNAPQVKAFAVEELRLKRSDLPRDQEVVGSLDLAGDPIAIFAPAGTPIVWCSYATQDRPFFKELALHLSVLEQQGVLQHIGAIADDDVGDDLAMTRADVIVLLLSPDYLASKRASSYIEAALQQRAQHSTTVLSVVLRPALWEASPLASQTPPLLAGAALSTLKPALREQAWVDVVMAIRQAVLFPPASRRHLPQQAESLIVRPLEEIFAHSGQPEVTYVETEQSRELLQRLRHMGQGLVVEGPSGVGKTTAVLRALKGLDKLAQTTYLLGTDPADLDRMDGLVQRSMPKGGHLVVDDFHRLDPARQQALALLIKRLSDRGRRDAKVTLIGINPVGATLVQDLPEMPRYSTIQMRGRQSAEEIDLLIARGERAANVEFKHRTAFIEQAEGSFAIAQRLCYEAALKAGVTETAIERVAIDVRPEEVLRKVHQDLAYRYRALLLAFSAAGPVAPPRGATLLLLWYLYRSDTTSVVVQEVRYQCQHDKDLDAEFEWVLASNLARGLFDQNPGLRRLLYYNRDAGVLSAEDPHLGFYLRHLEWLEFARTSGHAISAWDKEGGPLWRASAASIPSPSLAPAKPFFLLHLSDLHFRGNDKARLWHSQLAEDLRREARLSRVDAVVLTGDIANHATEEEYQEALEFTRFLTKEFSLQPHQLIPVPGNHDVSWAVSEEAYKAFKRKGYVGKLREGHYYAERPDSPYIEVRDEAEYKRRFERFASFYGKVRREPYPLDANEQAIVYHFLEASLLVLGLNSAWETDHHHPHRSSVNQAALSNALDEIRNTPAYDQSLIKIAALHHPMGGSDRAALHSKGLLERLGQAGFCALLHGHVHDQSDTTFDFYRDQHGMRILAAGTFGAPDPDRPPGVPLQYQILEWTPGQVCVRSRRRTQPDGAWESDPRFRAGLGRANLDQVDLPIGQRSSP